MHPLGEISSSTRYIVQPLLHGGYAVYDRVNGSRENSFPSRDEASEQAAKLNGKESV